MLKIYHCRPSELDEESDAIITLHQEFLRLENQWAVVEQKRAEQKARNAL